MLVVQDLFKKKEKVCEEECTLKDLLELVMWDDLRGMNLRGGVRCRLWRAILDHRTRQREEG